MQVARMEYMPVAKRGAILFFVMDSMAGRGVTAGRLTPPPTQPSRTGGCQMDKRPPEDGPDPPPPRPGPSLVDSMYEYSLAAFNTDVFRMALERAEQHFDVENRLNNIVEYLPRASLWPSHSRR